MSLLDKQLLEKACQKQVGSPMVNFSGAMQFYAIYHIIITKSHIRMVSAVFIRINM